MNIIVPINAYVMINGEKDIVAEFKLELSIKVIQA